MYNTLNMREAVAVTLYYFDVCKKTHFLFMYAIQCITHNKCMCTMFDMREAVAVKCTIFMCAKKKNPFLCMQYNILLIINVCIPC